MSDGYRGPGVYELHDRCIEVHGAAVEWVDHPERSVVLIRDGSWPPGGVFWFQALSEFQAEGWRLIGPITSRQSKTGEFW